MGVGRWGPARRRAAPPLQRGLVFENRTTVLQAIAAYRVGPAGVADHLSAQPAWAAQYTALVTFDRALAASDRRVSLLLGG